MKRGLTGLRVVSFESRRSAEVAELILAGLRQRGARVATVPVYGWALPEDTAPMRAVIERLVAGAVDAVLVSSATQIDNVFHVASEIGAADALREALRKRTVPPSCWSASGARK